MGNMFCIERRMRHRFDLKGSSLGCSLDKIEVDENTTLNDRSLLILETILSWVFEFVIKGGNNVDSIIVYKIALNYGATRWNFGFPSSSIEKKTNLGYMAMQ